MRDMRDQFLKNVPLVLLFFYLARRTSFHSGQFQNPAGRNQLSANPAGKKKNIQEFKHEESEEHKTGLDDATLTGLDMSSLHVGGRNLPLAAGNTPINCSRGLN